MKAGHEIPVNRNALRVISRGESFEYRIHETTVCSSLPLPIRELTDVQLMHPEFEDLSGSKFGKLTVMGLSLDFPGRWVCRCICGMHVVRRAKTVKNGSRTNPCDQCYELAASKSREFYRRTGKSRPIEEFMY